MDKKKFQKFKSNAIAADEIIKTQLEFLEKNVDFSQGYRPSSHNMSGKLEGVAAFSMWHPRAVKFCQAMGRSPERICAYCYFARAMILFRSSVAQKVIKCAFFHERGNLIQPVRLRKQLLRFNSFGELSSESEVEWFFDCADRQQHMPAALYTKRPEIVQRVLKYRECPDNLVLIYSWPWIGEYKEPTERDIPQGFHKIFAVYENYSDRINCGQRICVNCQLCYHRKGEKIIRELEKEEALKIFGERT